MEAFIHGVVLAFGLILPLGVQNLFVFNQGALQANLWQAMPAVVTASICDTVLILAAVMGVSIMILSFAWLKTILLAGGFVFLVYMGWLSWKSSGESDLTAVGAGLTPGKQIVFAASVSLLNPHAILDTIGVIGTSSLYYSEHSKMLFTTACILVSWLWFFALAFAGRLLGSLDNSEQLLAFVGKFSAVFIWGAALYLGHSLISGIG